MLPKAVPMVWSMGFPPMRVATTGRKPKERMGMQAMSHGVRFIIMDDANFYNGGGHRSYPGKTNEFAVMSSLPYPMKGIC
jgi:hypothetical protein